MSYSYFSDSYADVAAKPTRQSTTYIPPHNRYQPTQPTHYQTPRQFSTDHGRGRGRGRTGFRDQYGNFGAPNRYNSISNQFNKIKISKPEPENENENENEKENLTAINFDAYEDIPVEVIGSDIPKPVSTFTEIDLGQALNNNIKNKCKYVKPTPIQRHAIPVALAGRDLMACAQTGSGKTAAFCFPIISGVLKNTAPATVTLGYGRRASSANPVALILSPTRELCCQVIFVFSLFFILLY